MSITNIICLVVSILASSALIVLSVNQLVTGETKYETIQYALILFVLMDLLLSK